MRVMFSSIAFLHRAKRMPLLNNACACINDMRQCYKYGYDAISGMDGIASYTLCMIIINCHTHTVFGAGLSLVDV